ncbi:type II toxin-antitoxin system VapC family toxin [Pedobacter rhodius]|uniref:Type II toxin-antitoxin system VapC family toxin n=1 Tax=Pedobacter rhodius TaxID=3004098 RepID=A0ABT4KWL2_9SPHI|nr:type II toxin-antitoxin system VapC family toxin [Pedobacter sp. SJ11]MCZ4223327.1 type II toxin-antitoxin system VapC family toxin [Pedobacter sp. SJ11]
MGVNFLWDTNTVIYYLQRQLPLPAEKFIDEILSGSRPAISAITEIELRCWKAATQDDITVLNNFINDSFVYELYSDVKDKTVELRKDFNIKLPDAIIAATALVNNFTLLSRNSKDFVKIKNLKFINPFDL